MFSHSRIILAVVYGVLTFLLCSKCASDFLLATLISSVWARYISINYWFTGACFFASELRAPSTPSHRWWASLELPARAWAAHPGQALFCLSTPAPAHLQAETCPIQPCKNSSIVAFSEGKLSQFYFWIKSKVVITQGMLGLAAFLRKQICCNFICNLVALGCK